MQKELRTTTIASAIAGSIGKLFVHPIETIKAKVQVNRSRLQNLQDFNRGLVRDLIKKTYKQQGIAGFYRGVVISALGSSVAFGAMMTVYEYCKQVLPQNYAYLKDKPALNYFIAGFIAEFVSCAFWLPIDVIKERMQVQSELNLYRYGSATQAAQKIKNSEGIRGLYRAFGATLAFFGPYSAMMFVFYEKFKKMICKDYDKPGTWENILASAGAASLAGVITNPLDLTKLRMQIQRADKSNRPSGANVKLEQTYYGYRNMLHGMYLVVKTEGFLALFRGSLLRVVFTVPNTTISLVLTEQIRQIIQASKKKH